MTMPDTQDTPPAVTDSQSDPFPLARILASATDIRGVITYANPAFCAVSQYDRETLIGSPHRIVRHPEMPKGLYHLFWARLKAELPMCGYVQNLASDGSSYWVMALVTPMEGGFLSARIKASSPHFDAVRQIYAKMLKAEADGQTPDQSAKQLVSELSALGFGDFDEFVRTVLDAEISHRDEALGRQRSRAVEAMDLFSALNDEIAELVKKIGKGFGHIRGEPVNMRILAGRLEGDGAAIGTISQNYDTMAYEMHQVIRRMQCPRSGSITRMRTAIARGRFAAQLSQLLAETTEQALADEGRWCATDPIVADTLPAHRNAKAADARTALRELAAASTEIGDFCRQLRRQINGLDVVKLLCKVESGRIRKPDNGLQGIITRLDRFHEEADVHLAELATRASQISAKSASLDSVSGLSEAESFEGHDPGKWFNRS